MKKWGRYEGGYLRKRYVFDEDMEDMSEKKEREWIKRWRPESARTILRQADRQAKATTRSDKKCYTCEKMLERTVPYWLPRCRACVRRFLERKAGMFTPQQAAQVVKNVERTRTFFCTGCARTRTGSAEIFVFVCVHCLKKLVRRNLGYPKEERRVRDRLGRVVGSDR